MPIAQIRAVTARRRTGDAQAVRLTNEQRSFARDLRRRQTDAERRLWHQLRARQFMGLRFRRQHPIGRFFADFACVELHLVIELDGGQHNSADERRRDVARSDVLAAGGYRVIRFWDNDVLRNTEAVLESIARTVEVLLAQQESQAESPHPRCARPLPPKRER
jgi:very-short-patch-repair endonuclease